jgi:cytochrome c peroxidase
MRSSIAGSAAVLVALAAAAPAGADPLLDQARMVFQPLPAEAASAENPLTPEKIALGRMLYYEKRISKNHDLSCNSCHGLGTFGVDHEKTSEGHRGQRGDRNSPTVYNAAFHVAQFWDGRAPTVEEQAKGPVLNPVEMAMPAETQVLEVLESIPGYAPAFAAAFPGEADPITYDNFGRAVGAFERRLVTPSRFDAYLGGDASALTAEEKKGLQTFIATGCPTCHNGVAIGGGMFQKLGLVEPYPTQDKGRAKVTGRQEDEYVFKVPSLRNVAKTGPWFHDGGVDTLDMAVRLMARFQLGRTLTDAEAGSIAAFLNALTGAIPTDYVAEPVLPESGPTTPRPDPS